MEMEWTLNRIISQIVLYAGVSLKKDSENSLYIIDGTDVILIQMSGGVLQHLTMNIQVEPDQMYYYSSSAYAVKILQMQMAIKVFTSC